MQGLLCIDNHYHSEICVMCYLTEDFELIEEQTIDIDSIEELETEYTMDGAEIDIIKYINEKVVPILKHLNKEIQSIKGE